jgi:hypothetical protein
VFSLLLAVLKKGRQYTELVCASWSSKLVLVCESVQSSFDSRIQEATSASVKMFPVIVMCAAVNLQSV